MCHQGVFSRLYGRAKTNRCTRVNSVIFSNKPLLLQDYFDWPGFAMDGGKTLLLVELLKRNEKRISV